MTTRRNLSGVFFRTQDPENKKWGNVVFEELSEVEQKRVMKGRSKEWLQNLATILANTLKEIGDKFDIVKE